MFDPWIARVQRRFDQCLTPQSPGIHAVYGLGAYAGHNLYGVLLMYQLSNCTASVDACRLNISQLMRKQWLFLGDLSDQQAFLMSISHGLSLTAGQP
jgi:hypothetical protein